MRINNLKIINMALEEATSKKQQKATEYFAATIIQKHYRGYSVRQNNDYRRPFRRLHIDIKLRKTICSHMEILNAQITFSPSAAIFNGVGDAEIKSKLKGANYRVSQANIKEELINCINTGVANCQELTMIQFCLLENDPNICQMVKSSLKLIAAELPNDHMFVMCGDYVIDLWVKYLRLSLNYQQGPISIFIEPEIKKRGFFGTYEDYENFLAKYPGEPEPLQLIQVDVDLIKNFCFIDREEIYAHFMKIFSSSS